LLASVTYCAESAADAFQVGYLYYPDRSLKEVRDQGGRRTFFDYYQSGSLKSIRRQNGSKRMFTYTAAGELSSMADIMGDQANGTGMVFYCNFAYNARGQLEQRKYFPVSLADATRSPALNATFNPNTAIGSSPFTAAIAAARQGNSWTVSLNTAAASPPCLTTTSAARLCHIESRCSGLSQQCESTRRSVSAIRQQRGCR
jgi:YD repeat-containing protein